MLPANFVFLTVFLAVFFYWDFLLYTITYFMIFLKTIFSLSTESALIRRDNLFNYQWHHSSHVASLLPFEKLSLASKNFEQPGWGIIWHSALVLVFSLPLVWSRSYLRLFSFGPSLQTVKLGYKLGFIYLHQFYSISLAVINRFVWHTSIRSRTKPKHSFL